MWKDNAAIWARPRRHGFGQHAAMLAAAWAFLLAMATAQPTQGQGFTLLHAFAGATSDGGDPEGSLVRDASGNLYGTTVLGGSGNNGTVFELVYNSPRSYTENVLYSFKGWLYGDGENPQGSLVRDASGNLYGTTNGGGSSLSGTVFELVYNSPGNYTEEVLYSFQGEPDGANPLAALLMDVSGNLYGTTSSGGSNGYGTVFELVYNSPGNYTEYVLYNFQGEDDGANPSAALIMDASGNLYGTASSGGADGDGTVFELVYKSPETYTEQTLYTFTGGTDGGHPVAGLIMDTSGNLYGTTSQGGILPRLGGYGTVFELAKGSYKVLYSFTGGADGGASAGALVMNKSGDLYGTTEAGGSSPYRYGTVFELAYNSPESYTEYTLYTFTGGKDGGSPSEGLVMDSSGNLYGTADLHGAYGWGTAFELTPPIVFSHFAATLEIVPPILHILPPGFDLDGRFTLGAGAAALTPPTDAMTLTVGTYTVSIPSGSFKAGRSGESYRYTGVIDNVWLDIVLEPTGADTYHIEVTASGVNLTKLRHTATVVLTIGNNLGKTQAIIYTL